MHTGICADGLHPHQTWLRIYILPLIFQYRLVRPRFAPSETMNCCTVGQNCCWRVGWWPFAFCVRKLGGVSSRLLRPCFGGCGTHLLVMGLAVVATGSTGSNSSSLRWLRKRPGRFFTIFSVRLSFLENDMNTVRFLYVFSGHIVAWTSYRFLHVF